MRAVVGVTRNEWPLDRSIAALVLPVTLEVDSRHSRCTPHALYALTPIIDVTVLHAPGSLSDICKTFDLWLRGCAAVNRNVELMLVGIVEPF